MGGQIRENNNQIKLEEREKGEFNLLLWSPVCCSLPSGLCLNLTRLSGTDTFNVGKPCPALTTTLYFLRCGIQTVHSYCHLLKCFPLMVSEVHPGVSNNKIPLNCSRKRSLPSSLPGSCRRTKAKPKRVKVVVVSSLVAIVTR